MILDVLSLTETWLKPDENIILNEPNPKITVVKMSRVQKAKGEVLRQYSQYLSEDRL